MVELHPKTHFLNKEKIKEIRSKNIQKLQKSDCFNFDLEDYYKFSMNKEEREQVGKMKGGGDEVIPNNTIPLIFPR